MVELKALHQNALNMWQTLIFRQVVLFLLVAFPQHLLMF